MAMETAYFKNNFWVRSLCTCSCVCVKINSHHFAYACNVKQVFNVYTLVAWYAVWDSHVDSFDQIRERGLDGESKGQSKMERERRTREWIGEGQARALSAFPRGQPCSALYAHLAGLFQVCPTLIPSQSHLKERKSEIKWENREKKQD